MDELQLFESPPRKMPRKRRPKRHCDRCGITEGGKRKNDMLPIQLYPVRDAGLTLHLCYECKIYRLTLSKVKK